MSNPAAVYRLFGADAALLYIGAADDPERRCKHHSYVKPWWPEVERKTVEWHDSREDAEAAEVAAIKAERPRYNVIHAVERPPRPMPAPTAPRRHLTTTEAGALAGTSRHTVEREIGQGNLAAKKVSGRWIIEAVEADRWAAQYQPYAEQRGRHRQPPAD